MIYKHEQFILNTEDRRVFDENKKELRLTGNAYRGKRGQEPFLKNGEIVATLIFK